MPTRNHFEVVVCGGGIAGVEGLLRLRRLMGDRARITLVSPEPVLVYRPLAVQAPFTRSAVRRYRLERIAADVDARWVRDRVASVDTANRVARLGDGGGLPYDALLLAIGAEESPSYEHACAFSDRNSDALAEIVGEVESGRVGGVAFVLPHDWVWPLPLYELALLTAARARRLHLAPRITFITAEGRPLKAFGQAAGDAVTRLLNEAGIRLHAGAVADVPAPGIVRWNGITIEAERIVTLPKLTGRALRGIPAGSRWFIPIDERCVVPSTDGRVFAAGDGTDFAVKQGGIGAQQADTAAAGIAHLAGLGDRPPALEPVIRGTVLTGERPLYLAARLVGKLGWETQVYEQPPWPEQEKIVADELGPYLQTLDTEGP